MGIITEKVTNGQAACFWKRWFLFEAYLSVSKGIIGQDVLLFSMNYSGEPILKMHWE